MALIKCKMCGGDLILEEGRSVAECEYCGTVQTVPTADNEKKLTLFARANRLRSACEFDKAAGLYESIVAEFPQEAESYWGLVLCKYGIEYVDDPGSGKKIPTCHRSSFDSILEDSDFDQALENADAVARRVYREEAKQIEEIRKGIIAVSSREKPYDIFICYKETDAHGDRTLDSVLAQDIYQSLTREGYRTFFARITLEDKLGQEYEPYIFAALNSAQIMLVVGTDYEYFNAVWVKNEWSRFLKLMAGNHSKHLIPCYKGIDAYDMPKEFAKLQAQDLGKLGAMQDLLRGIEKLMPRAKAESETNSKHQESMPYDKGTTLLKRAQIALEDREWEKADKFYEEVLDLDPECAAAYLGKALIAEQCTSLSELVDKRARLRQDPGREEDLLEYKPEGDPIGHLIQEYAQHGFVEEQAIRNYYQDGLKHIQLVYTSDVRVRKKQKSDEEKWWRENKLLQRAEKYADEALQTEFQKEKARLMTILDGYIKKEQDGEQWGLNNAKENHRRLVAQVEEKIQEISKNTERMQEICYQQWITDAKVDQDAKTYRTLAENFRTLGDYRESQELMKYCEERFRVMEKIESEEAARREEKRIQQEKHREAESAAKAKKKKLFMIIGLIAVVILIALPTLIIPAFKHNKATALMDKGLYRDAYIYLDEAGDTLYYQVSDIRHDISECVNAFENDVNQTLADTVWMGMNGFTIHFKAADNSGHGSYISSNGTDTFTGRFYLHTYHDIGSTSATGTGSVTIMLDDEDPIFLPGAYLRFSVQSNSAGYDYTLEAIDVRTDDKARTEITLYKAK